MAEFFRQYKFKDTGEYIKSWDQFQDIRVGAVLVKNTGEEYEKTDSGVFTKVRRTYLDDHAVDNRNFAVVNEDNHFTVVQSQDGEPSEDGHLVTKAYVDQKLVDSKVNLNGFARTDETNEFEKIQFCNVYPTRRAHLTNKAYVDDKIDDLSFDTSSFAKLHISNTFTENQTIVADPVAPNDVVTKKYVDNLIDEQNVNLDNYVRSDLPNVYDAPQTYTDVVYVNIPKTEREAANKKYVDDLVTKIETASQHFARTDDVNTFTLDQTFNGYVISNTEPRDPEHVVNKGYVDEKFQVLNNDIKKKQFASIAVENIFVKPQTFTEKITVPDIPADADSSFGAVATNKKYVDEAIRSYDIPYPYANYDGVLGLVSINDDIEHSQPPKPDENLSTDENTVYKHEVPTSYGVRQYVQTKMGSSVSSNAQNQFNDVQYFVNGIVIGNKNHDLPSDDVVCLSFETAPFYVDPNVVDHSSDYYKLQTDGFVGTGLNCVTTSMAVEQENAGLVQDGLFVLDSAQRPVSDEFYAVDSKYVIGTKIGRDGAYRYVGLQFSSSQMYDVASGSLVSVTGGDPVLVNEFYVPLGATGSEVPTAKWLSSDERYRHHCPRVTLGTKFPEVTATPSSDSFEAYDILKDNSPTLSQLVTLCNKYDLEDTITCDTQEENVSLVAIADKSVNAIKRKSGFVRFVPSQRKRVTELRLDGMNIIIGNVDIDLTDTSAVIMNSTVIFDSGVTFKRNVNTGNADDTLLDVVNSRVTFAYDTSFSGTCGTVVTASNGSVIGGLPESVRTSLPQVKLVELRNASVYLGNVKHTDYVVDSTSYTYDVKDYGRHVDESPYSFGDVVDHSSDYYKQSFCALTDPFDYVCLEVSQEDASVSYGMKLGVNGTHVAMKTQDGTVTQKSYGLRIPREPSDPVLVNEFYVPLGATGDEVPTAKWLSSDSRYRRLASDVTLGDGLTSTTIPQEAKTDSCGFYNVVKRETPTMAQYTELSNVYGMYNTATISSLSQNSVLTSTGTSLLSGHVNIVPQDVTPVGDCVLDDQNVVFKNVIFTKGLSASDCKLVFDGVIEFRENTNHVGMNLEHCDVKFRKGCRLKFSGNFDTFIFADKHSDVHGISSMTDNIDISTAKLTHGVGAVVHNYSIIDDSSLPFDIELDAFSMAYKKAYDVEFTVNNASFKTATIRHGTKWKDVKNDIPTPVDGDKEFLGWAVVEDTPTA